MANINFYLHDRKSISSTQILLSLSFKGKRIKVKTGEKIEPKYWDFKKQKVKSTYNRSFEMNAFLRAFSDEVLAIYLKAQTEKIPITSQYIKGVLNPEKKATSFGVFEILDQFIETGKTGKSFNTIRNYKTFRAHLKGFVQYTGYELSFNTINREFRDAFHSYLVQNQGQSDLTVSKTFSVLKSFMSHATDYGFNSSIDYLHFKFRERPATKVSLTQEELQAIESIDLSSRPRLERVRDIFLFGCNTALRHSDILLLSRENIKTTKIDDEEITYLDLVAQKTRGDVQAPLSQTAINLIKKYKVPGKERGVFHQLATKNSMNILKR